MQREFELCEDTLQACEAAELGGADRIELCAALSEGGVSPSRGFLKAALSSVKTPVHVLIRPRSGDFVFTENEFRAMSDDVEDTVGLGAAGIVVGFLPCFGSNGSCAPYLRWDERAATSSGRLKWQSFHREGTT